MNIFIKYLSIAILCFLLLSCNKDDGEETASNVEANIENTSNHESSNPNNSNNSNIPPVIINGNSISSAPTLAQANQTTNQPNQPQSVILTPQEIKAVQAIPQAPPQAYGPTPYDVYSAFQTALNKTANTIPDSKEKTEWYGRELAKIQSFKIVECRPAPIGTPAACRIQSSGGLFDIRILLTKSGWIIVK